MYQTYLVTYEVEGSTEAHIVVSAASQVQAVAKAKKACGFGHEEGKIERLTFKRVEPGEALIIQREEV